MKKLNFKKEWLLWLVLLTPVIYASLVWNKLPGQLPFHFDWTGTPDKFCSRTAAVFLFPGLNMLLYLILLFAPDFDPLGKNYDQFQRSYRLLRLAIASLFTFLFIFSAETAMKHPLGNISYLMAAAFLFFVFFGNFMKTVRPNFFIGIRTPWTLMSQESWKKTHELLGKLWFYGGIAGLFISFAATTAITGYLFIAFAVSTVVLSFAASYFYYRQSAKTVA